MNIIEKADKYADGKANEAITKAIAQAYLDGYRDGYNDREAEIPVDLSEITRRPTLILACRAEHSGQKTMRRMMVIFSTFHMKGQNT